MTTPRHVTITARTPQTTWDANMLACQFCEQPIGVHRQTLYELNVTTGYLVVCTLEGDAVDLPIPWACDAHTL